jgi:sugar fermentation stimulation protein A
VRFDAPTQRATLIKRYKRFLADVTLDDGVELTVHCANPGSMLGLNAPGSEVLISDSGNPKRKLPHSLELVRVGRSWVVVNTARANQVVAEALRDGSIPELAGHESIRPEVRFGEKSRVDFLLEGKAGRTWVEVKSVTMAEGSAALFPDSVTARGLKHLEELTARVSVGDRAVMLFLVGRGDCKEFRPAAAIDPAYAEGLRTARDAGVEVLVHETRVRTTGIEIAGPLPACLDGA